MGVGVDSHSVGRDLGPELHLARQLAESVACASTFEDALEVSLRRICEVTGWSVGQAWVPDAAGERLLCSRAWYATDPGLWPFHEASRRLSLHPGEGLPGQVWESRRPHWSTDVTRRRDFGRASIADEVGLVAGMAVPVLTEEDLVAVVEFFVCERRERDEQFLALVSTVASQLGLMMRSKQATDALRASEAEFRAVVETAADAIISASSDGRITFFNSAAEVLFGRTAAESLGQQLTVLVPERLRRAHLDGFTRFVETLEMQHGGRPVEVCALRRDGTEFSAQLSLAHWSNHGEVYLTAIVRDMSDRVAAESVVRNALEAEQQVTLRLQELDSMKSTLLHTVSHDLRSPIAAILALTQVLKAQSDEPDASSRSTRLRLLGTIEATARRMGALLADLVNAERIDSVRPKVAPCRVDDLVRRLIDEAGLRERHLVRTRIRPVEVWVDAAQAERIVDNLLTNVVQHVPAGVPVWVGVEPIGDGVTISVEDAGPGVPSELHQEIFDVFRRGPDAAPGGTGIGLSLVARFAHLHGGRAWVEDRAGGGAVFRVFLPSNAADGGG